jgi:hypothetical protein
MNMKHVQVIDGRLSLSLFSLVKAELVKVEKPSSAITLYTIERTLENELNQCLNSVPLERDSILF